MSNVEKDQSKFIKKSHSNKKQLINIQKNMEKNIITLLKMINV